MQLRMQLLTHLRMQLLTHLRMQLRTCSVHATRTCCDATRTCSVDATAHTPAPWMRRLTPLLRGCDGSRTCSVDATAHAPAPWMRRHKHVLRGCDGALHASGGLRGVDRGLPSVRSARGLQGRQELELLTPGARRMLVCVTDFVLSLGAS